MTVLSSVNPSDAGAPLQALPFSQTSTLMNLHFHQQEARAPLFLPPKEAS